MKSDGCTSFLLSQCDVMKGPRQAKVIQTELIKLIINYMGFFLSFLFMKWLFSFAFWWKFTAWPHLVGLTTQLSGAVVSISKISVVLHKITPWSTVSIISKFSLNLFFFFVLFCFFVNFWKVMKRFLVTVLYFCHNMCCGT